MAEIVAYQERALAARGYVTFPGCIMLCRHEGNMLCIDGQHRLHAIEKLRESGVDFELVVEVFTCRDAAEVHELFRVVNSNRPVPLLDDTETVAAVALAIRDHVRGTYAAFVSGSARPNVPKRPCSINTETRSAQTRARGSTRGTPSTGSCVSTAGDAEGPVRESRERRSGDRARVQVGGEVEGREVLPRLLLAGGSAKRGAEQAAPRAGVAGLVRDGCARRRRRRAVPVL